MRTIQLYRHHDYESFEQAEADGATYSAALCDSEQENLDIVANLAADCVCAGSKINIRVIEEKQ
jgi:hypothetical protein